ncbi:MAG: hypothetical protein ACE15D_09840 [Candidatus Eisenbacteria bacterium]|nr:hypothetical protein [Candidatus Eisenbacteria bacterium]
MSGASSDSSAPHASDPPAPARDPAEERRIEEIQRASDRVVALILFSDLPLIDIRLAAADVRRLCQRLFPDRAYLYEWIYARRFRRLWQQWRGEEEWK